MNFEHVVVSPFASDDNGLDFERMKDLEIEIKGLCEPVDAELKRLYEGFRMAGLKRNNDEVERLAQKTIASEFKLLGLLIGKVQGAQTSVKLETYYYVSSSTLRDNRTWVLFPSTSLTRVS